MNGRTTIHLTLLAALAAGGCGFFNSRPADSTPVDTPTVNVPSRPVYVGDQEWDKAIIDQMERDARRLANADGCTDYTACRAAPIGAKACGGPRDYVVFCAATTDTVALFRKLAELARAEREYNEKYGIMSTCDLRTEPNVALVGQTCRAVR